MTLAHVDRPGLEDSLGVHFPMMDGWRSVRVHVAREAIVGKNAGFGGQGSCLALFVAGRDLFEILAHEKYDPKRPVAKIEIGYDDVVRVYRRLHATS